MKLTLKLTTNKKKAQERTTDNHRSDRLFLSISILYSLAWPLHPMALSFLSPISLYASYLRLCFTSSGLSRHAIDIDNDTTIHFWSQNPDNQTSTHKPSLVFIHGFGPAALWQWRRQVQFFSSHFNLYVPDLIFFGESTTKSSARSEIFQADSVSKLLQKLGVEKYSVVGTSYGGFVAYHVARMWPERVEKVVIASSGVNMRKSDNEELIRKSKLDSIGDLMLPKEASHLRALIGLAVFRLSRLHMIPDFFLKDFISKLYAENRSEKLELLKGLTLGRDETVNISPLQQDVLLVWGEHDSIFPLDMAIELKGLIGKNVKLESIKDASHVPQIERPNKFNYILNSFLCGSS
ncbi:hypothetical protein P3X46_019706 [Hevea brasiliensis]|uniref:AB hydrolase-1 domain-containing protein n=1 Tax=Hevea brasiliensis TaxID=3981 RepID=A0ABQ9LLK1_HEVBR|nr:uncharacterized protein LOC110662251 [Hevea brasiliensis]KAJ9168147.1 hypothetical protein P3X46_019706 [Hevea brasiliensis]